MTDTHKGCTAIINSSLFMQTQNAGDFLAKFPNTVIRYFDEGKKGQAKSPTTYNPKDVPPTYGAYFSVNGFRNNSKEKKDVININALHLDLDRIDGQKLTKEDVLATFFDVGAVPSILVETKNGFHGYWLLDTPFQVTDANRTATIESVEGMNYTVAKRIGADPSTADVSRVLRIPWSMHRKDPQDQFEIRIVHETDIRYSTQELRSIFPPTPRAQKKSNIRIQDAIGAKVGDRHKHLRDLAMSVLARGESPETAIAILVGVNATFEKPKDLSEIEMLVRTASDKVGDKTRPPKNTDWICSGKNDTPVPCMSNAMHAIRNKISVRIETFSNRMQIFDKKTNGWRSYEDHDTVRIYDELSHEHNFLAKVGKANVQDAIVAIAYENSIDVAVDYIQTLPEWDNTPRIDTWLETVCGVEEKRCNRQIAKNFIMGMVKRLSTRDPVKFDNALILYGVQELGKSTLMGELSGMEWYLEMNSKIKDKDFFIQLQGKALVEFSEGVTVSKADVSHIKAILSTRVDSYRPPYGRSNVDFPRRCVFAMTTNKNDVLRDETGERRWWPVHVKKLCDIAWLKNNRVQMFAEAKHRLLQGEKFWEVDKTELAEVHKDYRIEYDNEDLYVKWYKQLPESRKMSGVTVRDAHEGVWLIEIGEDKYNPNISWGEARNIGLILRGVLGLEYRQKRDGTDRVRAFFQKDTLEGYTMVLANDTPPVEELEEKDSVGNRCISANDIPF